MTLQPAAASAQDAVGEGLLALVGGVKRKTGVGGDIVHDLQHRATFVGAARRKVGEHLNGRQCSIGLVGGVASQIIEAVGEHANLDSGTIGVGRALVQGLLHLGRGGAVSSRRWRR